MVTDKKRIYYGPGHAVVQTSLAGVFIGGGHNKHGTGSRCTLRKQCRPPSPRRRWRCDNRSSYKRNLFSKIRLNGAVPHFLKIPCLAKSLAPGLTSWACGAQLGHAHPQGGAERSRASRVEPSGAECGAERSRMEPSGAEGAERAEGSRAEPSGAERSRAEPSGAESGEWSRADSGAERSECEWSRTRNRAATGTNHHLASGA